jgi:hypothetical protein
VANFVSVCVLGSHNLGFLPLAQYDQFEYITRPLVKKESVPELQAVWDDFEKDTDGWALWGLDDFEKVSNADGAADDEHHAA